MSEIEHLSREVTFWNDLIEKYLKPLEKDADKEKAMGNALKELRNQVNSGLAKLNFLFVTRHFITQRLVTRQLVT